jgi:hypothetical protein
MPKIFSFMCLLWIYTADTNAQITIDSNTLKEKDTVALRIINLNPFMTLHVDSVMSYQLTINKEETKYYWYLKNSPAGLRINKDNGLLSFKADRSFFLSGKLKYDFEYTVKLGVQSLANPEEKIDTNFTLTFYNTEIVLPKVKPTVLNTLLVEEGEPISFHVLCETGSFSLDDILFTSSIPINNYRMVTKCGDLFEWTPPYDIIKDTEKDKEKTLDLRFIGSSKFNIRDTATVRVIIKDALNYPQAKEEYNLVTSNIKDYILRLKYAFLQLDKRLKKTKNVRTAFDLTSATSALTGTILSTSGGENSKNAGKILPSIGVAIVPVKESTVPNRAVEQNQAGLIRSSIKRLEYMLYDYSLVGEKDMTIISKIGKLKEELKQSQMQLIDVPIEITNNMTAQQLDDYFNNPKVNKKYRLKGK